MIVYIYNIGVDLYNGFNGLRHRINWTYFTVLDGLAHPLYSISSVAKSATQLKRNDPRTRKDRISNVEINYYNLDVIISVGYRVKSRNGITFINVQP